MPSVLVVMDVDSTVIEQEVIEMLAAHAGVESDVKEITEAAMHGVLDFESSLRARVALLRGLPVSALDDVARDVQLTYGASELCETLHLAGHHVALVSGGFDVIVDRIAAELGVRYTLANRLEIVGGVLTGEIEGSVVDRAAKADALRNFAHELGIPMNRTIAVGDGANDIDMVEAAAIGVAFAAKPALQAVADVVLQDRDLRAVLPLVDRLD